jgi:hypothetical protein
MSQCASSCSGNRQVVPRQHETHRKISTLLFDQHLRFRLGADAIVPRRRHRHRASAVRRSGPDVAVVTVVGVVNRLAGDVGVGLSRRLLSDHVAKLKYN